MAERVTETERKGRIKVKPTFHDMLREEMKDKDGYDLYEGIGSKYWKKDTTKMQI